MKKFLILLMTVFVFFLISCGSDDTNDTNDKSCNDTCKAWETCKDGECVLTDGKCNSDKDCKDGKVCNEEHACVEKNDTECSSNADCPSDKPVCKEGTCVVENTNECSSNADCPSDKPVCKEGTCVVDGTSECVGLSFDAIERNPNYKNAYYQIDGDNYLSISFFAATPAGTYDLASGNNVNYETCEQCVLVYTGVSTEDDTSDDKAYFQTQGTMEILKGDANEGEVEGKIINVKLQEVTIDENTYHSTLVDGGGCFEIQTATWNTYPHCDEGATRCNGNVLETCDADSTWVTTTDCEAEGNICNQPEDGSAASCVVCVAGTKRCSEDKDVEVCKADQSGWEVATDCQDPEVCIDEDGEVACGTPFVCEDHDVDGVGNDAASATELTLPVQDKAGYVCKDVDDWYKFNLVRGEKIEVNLTFLHEDGDIDVKLFKGMPGEDASPVAGGTSSDDNETFSFQAVEDDTYYLQIVSKWVKKGNAYVLNITKEEACTSNESCTEGDKNLCDAGICVECIQDSDCSENSVCSMGTCFSTTENGCIGISFDIRAEPTIFGTFYLADAEPYHLNVQFFAETPVGTYDLASGNNTNYETCEQCVLAYSIDGNGETDKYFFQSQGTLEITEGEATSGESAGKITNIKLQEVTIDDEGDNPTYHSTPVQDGQCIEIETGVDSWSWNSMGQN